MVLRNLVENLAKLRTTNLLLSLVFVALAQSAGAEDLAPLVANESPKELVGVGITENLGEKIDLNLIVTNENGQAVPLGSYFDGVHPVILSPVYFSCPGLCNFHLNGLTDALKTLGEDWSIGKKFKVLSLSFDAKEMSDVAIQKKATYLKLYDRQGADLGWSFLTAKEAEIQAITKILGFKFRWDEATKEWAHSSAAIILTPDGRISRYLHGVAFESRDVKLALNEATGGKIGSLGEHVQLFCFKYDPKQSKYTLAASQVMKLGGGLMVLVMAGWLMLVFIRARRLKFKTAGR